MSQIIKNFPLISILGSISNKISIFICVKTIMWPKYEPVCFSSENTNNEVGFRCFILQHFECNTWQQNWAVPHISILFGLIIRNQSFKFLVYFVPCLKIRSEIRFFKKTFQNISNVSQTWWSNNQIGSCLLSCCFIRKAT